MKGTISGFSLQDALFLLGVHARTGELVVESGNNIGTMLFHKGNILQAFSPYTRALGDLLVEDGLITEEELIEILQRQKQNAYTPLGSLLLKTGRVSLEIIETMVHEQIRRAVKEFNSWNNLNYSFSGKDIQPYDRIHLATHEFISPDTLTSAALFLSAPPKSRHPASSASA